MEKRLHVIAFNIPYPADYGGVIDVFYRIKALQEAGVKVHLHCFQYGRERANILDGICESVSYYPRSRSFLNQLSKIPFIVKTRNHQSLLANLLNDDYPILFEGLHSCYFLDHSKLAKRKKIVRCHNIEHNYYSGLAVKAENLKERIYFNVEAKKLQRFEYILQKANHIAAISVADENYFQQKYGKTFLMPPCHPSDTVAAKEGRGEFILYHGDLSTQENSEAALFILNGIVPLVDFPFKIAGKNPSSKIIGKADELRNVEVIANPSHEVMQQLVSNAHINLLPTFQATGFKLKLLNALFNGRFCVGTPELVEGTGLSDCCEIEIGADGIKNAIENLLKQDFKVEMIEKRKALLANHTNSAVISKLLVVI